MAPESLGHEQLVALLRSEMDRGELLQKLYALAKDKSFSHRAEVWAPLLYQRDGHFFENFLIRNLDGRRHANVIRDLLKRAEAAEQDSLFRGLYGKVAEEGEWNQELLALACSQKDDAHVQRAVQRRELRRRWFSLSEETALALYRRNASAFSDFVQAYVRRGWSRNPSRFLELREEAKRHRDEGLHWKLFREFADEKEWKREVQRLLGQNVPAEHIAEELTKRHPAHLWNAKAGILVDFLEKYGAAVLPYLESNVVWVARDSAEPLLKAVAKLQDENLYWRIFFKTGSMRDWNRVLRELLDRPLDDEQLFFELQRRTPPHQPYGGWRIETDVALRLYRRNRLLFRPFIERRLEQADSALHDAATAANDEEFLDYLNYRSLEQLSRLSYQAEPHKWSAAKPDPKAQREFELLSAAILNRFERLFNQSPGTYVCHAANILSRVEAYGFGSFKRELERNPVVAYLARNQHDAWRQSANGIRELLESPNIHIQILGLDILSGGGEDAAQRVVENLMMLRALLLGRARANTKRKALRCMEKAVRQGRQFADRIMPILEETMSFRGKRAIGERILVAFVRLRRDWQRPAAFA